jgi:hypothetical protein
MVCPKAILDVAAIRKIPAGNRIPVVQPVVRLFIKLQFIEA